VEKPKLRSVISAQPMMIEGAPMILLQDPEHFSDQTLIVPHNEPMLFILGCFDGEHTVADIQEEFLNRYQSLLMTEEIVEIIEKLSESHFLDNDIFNNHRRAAIEHFNALPVRASCLAGQSYPEHTEALARLLDAMASAGRLHREQSGVTLPQGPLTGLIAPHIDFMRGGRVYGSVYSLLAEQDPPDVAVIYGTLHAPSDFLFIPSRKGYETPLGILETDPDILSALEAEIPAEELYADEFAHKSEHSIEFQVLCLQHAFQDKPMPRIIPILCSSLEPQILANESPDEVEEHRRFTSSLLRVLEASGKHILHIAGADLSHIGPAFGDPEPVSDDFMLESRTRDMEALETVKICDAEGFFRSLAFHVDRYRVCGLSPIYAMLKVMPPCTGRIVDYDQATDTQRTTCVSIAGIAFAP